MTKLLVEVAMDNAAFEDAIADELTKIFGQITTAAGVGISSGTCRDSNGNRVGKWEILVD